MNSSVKTNFHEIINFWYIFLELFEKRPKGRQKHILLKSFFNCSYPLFLISLKLKNAIVRKLLLDAVS